MKQPQYCLFLPSNLMYFLTKHKLSLLDIVEVRVRENGIYDRTIELNVNLYKLPIPGYDKEVLSTLINHSHMLLHLKDLYYRTVLNIVAPTERPTVTVAEIEDKGDVNLLKDLDKTLLSLPDGSCYQIDRVGDFIVTWLGCGIWSDMAQAENKIEYLKNLCNAIISHRNQVADVADTIHFDTLLRLIQAKDSLQASL